MPYHFYSEDLDIIRNSLTNNLMKNMLFILIESTVPLTSTELIDKLQKKSTEFKEGSKKYFYEKVRQFYPDEFEFNKRNSLFNLKEFVKDFKKGKDYIRGTIKKLKQLFDLKDWEIIIDNNDKWNRKSKINCFILSTSSIIDSNSTNNVDYSVSYSPSENKITIINIQINQSIEINWTSIQESNYRLGFIYHINHQDEKDICLKQLQITCKYDLDYNIRFYVRKKNKNYKINFIDVILKIILELTIQL